MSSRLRTKKIAAEEEPGMIGHPANETLLDNLKAKEGTDLMFGGRPRSSRCKNGHPWTAENSRMYEHSRFPGRLYRQCRICARERERRRYRCDDAYRERSKAKALAWYHRHKEGVQT
jgi:hypothetical protein